MNFYKSILQGIFNDYYERMIYELHPRPSVVENVNKMLHCGDPSCGNRYNQVRSFHMSCELVACLICVLHTFGRDLKCNPHIHALISEGGAGNLTPWRPVKHFDYTFLRNAFRKVLLEQLTSLKITKQLPKLFLL